VMFHQKVYEASGSRTIPDLIKTLRLRLARLQLRTILIPGRSEGSLAEHVAIYEALRARDADAAAAAARGHVASLSRGRERLEPGEAVGGCGRSAREVTVDAGRPRRPSS